MTAALSRYTHDGLVFEVTDTGPPDGRPVLMLHGFPEDRHSWSQLAVPLSDAGYRVAAPDQRGYSPGARPAGRSAYLVERLCADVLALADETGAERFDLVGHDWGAVVGWYLAARHPRRVRSLCALSVPHPRAFMRSFWRSSQALRSLYMVFFQLPGVPERILGARGGGLFASSLERSGLDPASATRCASRAADASAMTGPLNWYRALLSGRPPLPDAVRVPTLFVWGDRERFVSRAAAEGCGRWVRAPYRFEVLAGRTHWLPTTAAAEIAPLLLEHLAAAP